MCVLDDPDLRRSPIIKQLCGSDQVQSLLSRRHPNKSKVSRIPLKT